MICQICDKEYEDEGSFHKHLKAHKMTQASYYQTYFPRHDVFDGQLIRFKNKEYYFNTDFNDKANFKKWLESITPDKARQYVLDFLMKRKAKKGLIFAPTQVELKTLMLPGIKYINEKLGGYEPLCAELGLKIRFSKQELDTASFKDISRKTIFKDTREQTPLDFDQTTKSRGMKFGDYSIIGSDIYIERKSLGDAWGTLTGGKDRFEREIIRAKVAGAYLVVLIESPFVSVERYPFLKQVHGRIRIPVEFVYHTIRDLMQKYDHIQFLFVQDREEASRVVKRIFEADNQVRDLDLQLLYDLGKL